MRNLLQRFRRRPGLCCRDVNDFLAAYGEGALEDKVRTDFETHLAMCPRCKTYLDQYRTTVSLVKEAEPTENVRPPEELVHLTLDFLRKHLDEEKPAETPDSEA